MHSRIDSLAGRIMAMHPSGAMTAGRRATSLGAKGSAAIKRQTRSGLDGAIAVVPVFGLMGAGLDAELLGTPTYTLAAEFDRLAADKSVGAVVLEVDSAGGEINGISRAVDSLRRLRAAKPVIAYVPGDACGVAYWLTAQASKIIVSPLSLVGGIGLSRVHLDTSEANKRAGVRVVSLAIPDTKADFAPGTKITDAMAARGLAEVETLASVFVADVAAGRGVPTSTVREVWQRPLHRVGAKAVAVGLANSVGHMDHALSEAARFASARQATKGASAARSSTTPRPSVRSQITPTRRVPTVSHEDQMETGIVKVVAQAVTGCGWNWAGAKFPLAAGKAFRARRRFGLRHAGRGKTSADAVEAAVPKRVPNRLAFVEACQRARIDAEAAAFAASVMLAQSAAGGLWFFTLDVNGVRVGDDPPPLQPGQPSIAQKMQAIAKRFPALKESQRAGMFDRCFVPEPV